LFRWAYPWLERQSHRPAVQAWLTSPFELELRQRREARQRRESEKMRYREQKAEKLRAYRSKKRAEAARQP
jgi:hypothetical protein